MVDSKRYNPTITRFQKHTKNFVSGKTKKGHLNNEEREPGDYVKEEGILVRINKKDLQGKSWEVKVGEKTYLCSYYGNSFLFLPNCTETEEYYLPKKEYKVEVSIDKKSKLYTITKIQNLKTTPNEQLISIIEGEKINIQGTKDSSLTLDENGTSISGNGLTVEGNVSVGGDIEIDTSQDDDLPNSISMTELYKKVRNMELKLSDNNDSE